MFGISAYVIFHFLPDTSVPRAAAPIITIPAATVPAGASPSAPASKNAPHRVTAPRSTAAISSTAAPVPLASWIAMEDFNGTSDEVTLPGPELNTGAEASFTVSAWVKISSSALAYLSEHNQYATAVSEDTAMSSSFFLQYSVDDKAWAFSRVYTDTVGAGAARALSEHALVVPGKWTHLVGVYSAPDGELSLYVGGVLCGSAQDATPFAGGDVVIGRARSNGGDGDWFPGFIKSVNLFQLALTPEQVSALT
jgi:Concanavalin A-like lectin/glucanases superfamily